MRNLTFIGCYHITCDKSQVYVDDYFSICATEAAATWQFNALASALLFLGLPIGSYCRPTQVMTLLGILFDTVNMRLWLAGHKRTEVDVMLQPAQLVLCATVPPRSHCHQDYATECVGAETHSVRAPHSDSERTSLADRSPRIQLASQSALMRLWNELYIRALAPFGTPSLVAMQNFMLSMKTKALRTGGAVQHTISADIRLRAIEWRQFITDGIPITNWTRATSLQAAYSDACEFGLGGWNPSTGTPCVAMNDTHNSV